jgi:DNA-binding NarL/FixJ family response regulator
MTQPKTLVLMVEDQKLFAESLRYVLQYRAEDLEITGIARNGREALEMIRQRKPHLVLMDVRMPEMDGVQTARVIHEMHPDIKILMLSTFQDDDYVRQAMQHGAVGYLLKNIAPDEVAGAIRAVMAGIMQISPAVARSLMKRGPSAAAEVDEELASIMEGLTKREREVLALIAAANENQEIARTLGVSEQTARNYVHNLYSKLGVSNRTQLQKLLARVNPPSP